jgi:hypothetical protein
MAGCYEHGNEPSVSIRGGEFLDKLGNCQLVHRGFGLLIGIIDANSSSSTRFRGAFN